MRRLSEEDPRGAKKEDVSIALSDIYQSPLSSRYASREMSQIFSPLRRAQVWRQLWIALAKAQSEQGLPISKEQIKELEQAGPIGDVSEWERKLRHDVMAHIAAFGEQAPGAKGILHLGATSTYVTDNGDLILMREALKLLEGKLVKLLRLMAAFARSTRSLACLAYTHLQPAQPTTLGKRATLWTQDFLLDLRELQRRLKNLPFLGVKGATGTQASFVELGLNADRLEERVAELMGFENTLPLAGQTYTRKLDAQILDTLSGLAISASKFATDLRLLAHLQEMEEPFETQQVGSSAMPHKRNPVLSERICALARYAISTAANAKQTAATQWLERSLDDSANRRMVIPESFLTADALLNLLLHIMADPVIYPKVIARNLERELPFLLTERILMLCVKKGGDRQLLHERLRHHAQQVSGHMKETGAPNDLLEKIAADEAFSITQEELSRLEVVGRAPDQVDNFLQALEQELEPCGELEVAAPPIEF